MMGLPPCDDLMGGKTKLNGARQRRRMLYQQNLLDGCPFRGQAIVEIYQKEL